MPRWPSQKERFWSNINKNGPIPSHVPELGQCWEWKACIGSVGYGLFWANSRNTTAHRFSWELHNGPIPCGLWVLHKCDNRKCANPSHLFLGTCKDNRADCAQKGRIPSGEEHHSTKHPEVVARGSRNGMSKLTESDAKNALFMRAEGLSLQSIADKYDVTKQSIWQIVHGKTWRHINAT